MNKSEQGKKSRKSGAAFERKVRKDLEAKGWIVDKWTNNVELGKLHCGEEGTNCILPSKIIPAKRKYNPFKKAYAIGTGFPDFICFKHFEKLSAPWHNRTTITQGRDGYEIIAVEVKSNGRLDKIEKEKCKWYIENNTFSKILIASKGKKRGEIVYKEFEK